MSKTRRKDNDKFDKMRYQNSSKKENFRYDKYDLEEDQEENYERIRPKTRPSIIKQTKETS